jgi:glucokinase
MILAGDLGGTKTLLALFDGDCRFKVRYESADFADFADLLRRFLDEAGAALGRLDVHAAALGVAGPVIGEQVKLTNLPWHIDARALAARFGFGRLRLLNDFAAVAHGVSALGTDDLITLQAGQPIKGAPCVAIGAGTGLGVAYTQGAQVISGEGGHMAFAPANARQAALRDWLQQGFARIETELVVSGPGLVRIFEFLAHSCVREHPDWLTEASLAPLQDEVPAAAITQRALQDGDPLAGAAVDLFIDCYGSVAGDHALAVLARGGVFIAGGVAPHLLPRLPPRFLAAFNDKGSFTATARNCPVHLIVNTEVGLLGAARAAQQEP